MVYLRLILDLRVLLLLVAGSSVAMFVAFVASRRGRLSRLHLSITLGSLWLVVVAMFFIGRGALEYKGVYIDDAVACLLTNPVEGLAGWDAEAVLNVVLYMPFTASLVLLTRKIIPVVAGTIALAVILELFQVAMSWGACGGPDYVRNILGVLLAALPTWALLKARGPQETVAS